MKKQNIEYQNDIQEKNKLIMKQKIQFYQNQLKQSTKRQANLKSENQNLKKSLNQVLNDKNKILNFITPNIHQSELHKQKIKAIEDNYTKKINDLTFTNQQYLSQIARLEDQLKNQVNQATEKYNREKQILEKKISKYELTIDKYHKICNEIEPSSVFNHKSHMQNENLKKQNEFLRKKIADLQKIQNNSHFQSFSTIIPQAHFNGNQSYFNMNNNDIHLKNSLQRETSHFNDQNSNNYTNRKLNQSIQSNNRISINKDKSRISNYSSIKPKSVATTLYCEQCQRQYPPNQFYCHLKIHNKEPSRQKKSVNEESKQKELENVFIVIKNHKKCSPSNMSRQIIR